MDIAELALRINTRGLKQGEQALTRFDNQMEGTADRAKRMGASIARVAGGLAGAVTSALSVRELIRVNAEFSSSMAGVQAVSGATAEEFKNLRNLAKELGGTTEFSASQAADGMRFLAQAGFDANEILAATPTVLDLATASATDMATAGDILSNIMSGFSIPATQAANAADVLAATAASSNTNLQQLGLAMSYVAPLASSAGVSIEQAAAAVGVLSDNGIQGSRAGTGLSAILRGLQSPSKKARAALHELGLSFEDVDLKGESLTDVFAKLGSKKFEVAEAAALFGAEAAPAAIVLAKNAARARELELALGKSEGALAEMAKTMRDTLRGSMAGTRSAFENLLIVLGDAGATNLLRSAFDAMSASLRWAAQNLHLAVPAFGALVAVAGALIAPVTTAGVATAAIGATIGVIVAKTEIFQTALAVVRKAVAPLAPVFDSLGGALRAAFSGNWNTALLYLAQGFERLKAALRGIGLGPVLEVIRNMADTYISAIQDNLSAALESLSNAWAQVKGAFANIKEAFSSLQEVLSERDWSGATRFAGIMGDLAGLAIEGIATSLELFARGIETITGAIAGLIQGDWSRVSTEFREFFTWLTSGLSLPDWIKNFSFGNLFEGVDVGGVASTIRGWFPSSWEEVRPAWLSNLSAASLFDGLSLQGVTEWFKGLFPSWEDIRPAWLADFSIATLFPDINLDGVREWFSGLWPSWEDVKPAWFDKLNPKNWFGSDDTITVAQVEADQSAIDALQTSMESATNTAAKLRAEFQIVVTSAKDAVAGVLGEFNGLPAALSKITIDAMVQVAGGIKGGGSVAVKAAKSLSAEIAGAFKGLAVQMEKAGRDAGDGLVRGLQSKASEVKNLGKQIADDTAKAFRAALQIRSPSRKFKLYGQNIVEGLAQGIEQNAQTAVAKTKDMAANVSKVAEKEFIDIGERISTGFGDIFGNVISGNVKSFKDFAGQIKDMFTSLLADLAKQALTRQLNFGGTVSLAGGGAAGGVPAIPGQAGGAVGGLGKIGGFLGKFGGGFSSGLSSVVSGLFSGGLKGAFGAIGTALKGITAGVGGFATALGALAGPVAIVGLLLSGFKKKVELLDSGLRVTVDGMDALVETFKKTKTTRFWGLSKKTRTQYEQASSDVADPIQKSINEIGESVMGFSDTLGLATDNINKASFQFQISTKGKSEEEIQKLVSEELLKVGDAFTGAIVGSYDEFLPDEAAIARIQGELDKLKTVKVGDRLWDTASEQVARLNQELEAAQTAIKVTHLNESFNALQKEGESAFQTLERLATNLSAVNATLGTLGATALEASLASGGAASQFVDVFGDIEAMQQAASGYFQTFYSGSEQLATARQELSKEFDRLGVGFADNLESYRHMIDQSLSEGQYELAAELINLSAAFNEVNTVTNEVVGVVNDGLRIIGQEAWSMSEAAIAAASAMADLAGGAQQLASMQSFYAQNFYSDAERLQQVTDDVNSKMAELGFQAPKTAAEFRALVESLDLSKEAAQAQYVELLKLAPGYKQVFDAEEKAAAEAKAQREAEARAAAQVAQQAAQARQRAADEARRLAGAMRKSW